MKYGDILVRDDLFYKHYGIMVERGNVIHNSKLLQGVVLSTYELFADGKDVTLSKIPNENPSQTAENARSLLGQKYDLFAENCEHFVRACSGNYKFSFVLQKGLLSAAALAMIALIPKGGGLISGMILMEANTRTPEGDAPWSYLGDAITNMKRRLQEAQKSSQVNDTVSRRK
jgi:hypothetical protein